MSKPVALIPALGQKHALQFAKFREQALILLKTTPATCPHRLVEELNAVNPFGVRWEICEGGGMGIGNSVRMMVTHTARNSLQMGEHPHYTMTYTKNVNGIEVLGQAAATQAAETATYILADTERNSFAGYLGMAFEQHARKEAGQAGVMVDRIALWAIASRAKHKKNERATANGQFRHAPSLPLTANLQALINLATKNIAIHGIPRTGMDFIELDNDQGIMRFENTCGVLTAQIEFSEGMWSGLEEHDGKATLSLNQDVPASTIEALTGRKLRELIDHPLLNALDLTITKTQWFDTFKVTMTEEMFAFIPTTEAN